MHTPSPTAARTFGIHQNAIDMTSSLCCITDRRSMAGPAPATLRSTRTVPLPVHCSGWLFRTLWPPRCFVHSDAAFGEVNSEIQCRLSYFACTNSASEHIANCQMQLQGFFEADRDIQHRRRRRQLAETWAGDTKVASPEGEPFQWGRFLFCQDAS